LSIDVLYTQLKIFRYIPSNLWLDFNDISESVVVCVDLRAEFSGVEKSEVFKNRCFNPIFDLIFVEVLTISVYFKRVLKKAFCSSIAISITETELRLIKPPVVDPDFF